MVFADCSPPPAPLLHAVRVATRFVSHHIEPMPTPAVCMTDMLGEGIAAGATSRTVYFQRDNARLYDRGTHRWRQYDAVVLLHEVLHQYGLRWGPIPEPYRAAEEAIVSAVTADLEVRWVKHFTGRSATPLGPDVSAYGPRVRMMRRAGDAWWRLDVLLTTPSLRSIPLWVVG